MLFTRTKAEIPVTGPSERSGFQDSKYPGT